MADSRHIPSKRFAGSPKDIPATAPLYAYVRPESEKQEYPIPAHIRIKTYKAHRAAGSTTWRLKGGMMGGSGGACRGVASHLGVVPQAFCKP
jgi:hypothetical protein